MALEGTNKIQALNLILIIQISPVIKIHFSAHLGQQTIHILLKENFDRSTYLSYIAHHNYKNGLNSSI